jgi:hypothetical protein
MPVAPTRPRVLKGYEVDEREAAWVGFGEVSSSQPNGWTPASALDVGNSAPQLWEISIADRRCFRR